MRVVSNFGDSGENSRARACISLKSTKLETTRSLIEIMWYHLKE